ncbi:hypothetical protein K431DRAFT_298562 [Polychaeton citri CBS 116435]|uniref:Uncharacterized protein n=1 Tax=Polychaeton citri CBS 116435 TaxID=1314669 RepID=A0A9P4UKR6_9PEZI|nr:hypothetical protein K431DRAFT_298562 [Polychaeton citri CBS 116435]
MAACLLFCISEDTKAVDCLIQDSPKGTELMSEVQSPLDGEEHKTQLKNNEPFDSDFIGAAPEDCQKWLFGRQSHDRSVDQNLVAVVDARGYEPLEFGRYGALPAAANVRYDFRINYCQAGNILAALQHVAPDVTYPTYCGNKDKFMDEHGVFDVCEADRFCMAEAPDVK